MTTQEMKAFTVRLDPDEYEWLMKRAHLGQAKPNRIIRLLIQYMRDLLDAGKIDLRGYFSADEWGFLAHALQFLPITTTDKNKVIGLINESKLLQAAIDLFPIELPELTNKILDHQFNVLHTLALCEIIRDYWDNYQGVPIVDWARQQARV